MYFKDYTHAYTHGCRRSRVSQILKKSLTETFLVVSDTINGLVLRGPPGKLPESLCGKVGGSSLIRDNPVRKDHYLRGT